MGIVYLRYSSDVSINIWSMKPWFIKPKFVVLLLPGNSQFNFFPPLIAVIVDFICMEFYTISSIMYFFDGPALMGFNDDLS